MCIRDSSESVKNKSDLRKDSVLAAQKDSIKKAKTLQPEIKYTAFIFPKEKKDSAMAVFNKEYSEEEQYTILALNRLDSKNKWRSDTLAIPDKIDSTLMSYSPFPSHRNCLLYTSRWV